MHVFALKKQKESHEKNRQLMDQAGLFEFNKPTAYTELESLERQISDAMEQRKYVKRLDAAGEGELITTEGTLYKLIDGVKCFIKYKVNRAGRFCDFWVYPQKYQDPLFVRAGKIDVTAFRINDQVHMLKLTFPNSQLGKSQSSTTAVPKLEYDACQ